METKIEVGDTVKARCSGGYGCIRCGDRGVVSYISENNNPHVLFARRFPEPLCMYREELTLVRKAGEAEG